MREYLFIFWFIFSFIFTAKFTMNFLKNFMVKILRVNSFVKTRHVGEDHSRGLAQNSRFILQNEIPSSDANSYLFMTKFVGEFMVFASQHFTFSHRVIVT